MEIIFHKSFKKDFKKLSFKVREKFKERLIVFMTDASHPLLNNHSVSRVFPRCRSINITGDVRAIYEERDDGVLFMAIGTHSDLY
jgi:addiction module RelE/StbE family toxin